MSLNYSLSIAQPANFDQLQQVNTSSIWSLYLCSPGPLETDLLRETFGFTPNITLTLKRTKQADPITARQELVRLTLSVLVKEFVDAVLIFNGEHVILWRRQGQWLLDASNDFWTTDILSIMPKYKHYHMPDL